MSPGNITITINAKRIFYVPKLAFIYRFKLGKKTQIHMLVFRSIWRIRAYWLQRRKHFPFFGWREITEI